MSTKTVSEVVADVLLDQLSVFPEEIKPKAEIIVDLGADSLDVIEMIMALEDKFVITIPDLDIEKLRTVGDVVRYIEKRLKKEHE